MFHYYASHIKLEELAHLVACLRKKWAFVYRFGYATDSTGGDPRAQSRRPTLMRYVARDCTRWKGDISQVLMEYERR